LKGSKEGKKPGSLTLTVDAVEAFENLKKAVMTVPVLIHYDPQKEIQVETDASDVAIAGILSQPIGNQEILNTQGQEWHPVAFYSSKLLETEGRYNTHNKELIAIVECFKH